MIDPERLRACLHIFRKMLNVHEDFDYKGIPIADLLPHLERDMAKLILAKGDDAEAIFDWLSRAVLYCLGEIDDLPQVEIEWNLKPNGT